MPPGLQSRHTLTTGVTRVADGLTYLLDREPFRFVARSDTRRVIAQEGDTWQTLAATHLGPIVGAEHLWWVIPDFQPDAVVDPTTALRPGSIIYIPSPEFVLSELFSDVRRDEVEI